MRKVEHRFRVAYSVILFTPPTFESPPGVHLTTRLPSICSHWKRKRHEHSTAWSMRLKSKWRIAANSIDCQRP